MPKVKQYILACPIKETDEQYQQDVTGYSEVDRKTVIDAFKGLYPNHVIRYESACYHEFRGTDNPEARRRCVIETI